MSRCYRSYADMAALIAGNIDSFAKYSFDLVVGVPRSGMIPAYMIALFFNINCCSFPEFRNNYAIEKCGSRTIISAIKYPQDAQRILVVEDSFGKGERLAAMMASLPDAVRARCIVSAIYTAQPKNNILDFSLEHIPKPRFFEWNIYHHILVKESAFDIDGVLCADPTEEENDDGEKYIEFLLNARPKFIPTLTIHTLVTSRLEKYRPQTVAWLQREGVLYKNLVMLDLPSKEARKNNNAYATHKAEMYRNDELKVFFESNDKQAQEIFTLTGKPVFSVNANKYYC